MRSIRGVEVEQVVVLPCNLQTELWIKLQQPKPNQPITNFFSFLSFPFFLFLFCPSCPFHSPRAPTPTQPDFFTFSSFYFYFYLVFNDINIYYLFIFKYHLNFISFSNTRSWFGTPILYCYYFINKKLYPYLTKTHIFFLYYL